MNFDMLSPYSGGTLARQLWGRIFKVAILSSGIFGYDKHDGDHLKVGEGT